MDPSHETIILGGGCFWCIEAVFQRVEGVKSALSGFAGGHKENPAYKEVTRETTGHAEVVQVTFDPEITSLSEILDIFFLAHDPTTLNRQGNDIGEHYRSAIYYPQEEQLPVIQAAMQRAQKKYTGALTTEVKSQQTFYAAEDYHQNYYQENTQAGYCQYVIHPKLKKLGL